MANAALRLSENVPGDFFVDSTCIDCDACRQIAPETFAEDGDYSIVHRQPRDDNEIRRAMMALVACPTASIGTVEHHDAHIGIDAFPELIAENVFYCGFNAESSFGAWSYLVTRPGPAGGNVLIDSPRFATQLIKKIDAMGGLRTMFLTHKDDVADHQRFSDRYACERIMHADDGAARLGVERIIRGTGAVDLDEDFTAIPVPGHTRGHIVLLYKKEISFYWRSFGVVTKSTDADSVSQRVLVLMDRTNQIHGEATRLRVRVGTSGPRPHSSRQRREHPYTS